MPDNTPSLLRELLNNVLQGGMLSGHQFMKDGGLDQAEQAILALFMECLPRPYNKAELEDVPQNKVERMLMINEAIDITAQNMRALGSRDEQTK